MMTKNDVDWDEICFDKNRKDQDIFNSAIEVNHKARRNMVDEKLATMKIALKSDIGNWDEEEVVHHDRQEKQGL